MELQDMQVIVTGAGIGGLAAAALLACKGAAVTVLEAQDYPGGCAATFRRAGYRFDAGATVGCGFHRGGPMDVLAGDLGISWPVKPEKVAWQYRNRDTVIGLMADREEVLKRFPSSRGFWNEQSALANLLWKISGSGIPWPAGSLRDLGNLLRKGFSTLPSSALLLKYATHTAYDWLSAHGLHDDPDFVRFIDAQLLVSVQTTSRFANAVNAAIALDLPASGTFSVKGGMGTVATMLAECVEKNGGAVLYRKNVIRIDSVRRQVIGVETSDGGAFAADYVIANLTPRSLGKLEGAGQAAISERQGESRWSAFTLYLGMDPHLFGGLPSPHIQIVGSSGEFGEGNSIFVSVSPADEPERAPEGLCPVTISTHAMPERWFEARKQGEAAYGELKTAYTEKILRVLSEQFPGARDAIRSMSAGTPVTWERYTGRPDGCVGGYPQTTLFGVRGPATRFDNLFLAGDSIFPGQSLPGVVTGARRTVELLLQRGEKDMR
jgi:C-3',4' desaturase CrtD